MGSSLAQMAAKDDVLSKVENAAKEMVENRVEHEISRILNTHV